MPFGLFNAPGIFQGYVNKILAEKLNIFVFVYLDDILIYIKDPGQPHVEAVRWVLNHLRKHSLFANLKKCRFYQDEVCFLGYVVLSKGISMEVERIEVVKDWPEPKSVCDIQVFRGFANFYWRFIHGFSRIAAPLISMLKTTGLPNEPAPNKNNGSRSASSSYNNRRPAFGRNDDNGEVDRFCGDSVEYTKKSGKSKDQNSAKSQKLEKSRKLSKLGNSKGKNLAKSKKPSKSGNSSHFDTKKAGLSFLTPKAKAAFNRLRLAFTEALILWHFGLECHIRIETDILRYAIDSVLS